MNQSYRSLNLVILGCAVVLCY